MEATHDTTAATTTFTGGTIDRRECDGEKYEFVNNNHHDDEEEDEDDDEYSHLFQSIRSSTGLEIGIRVTWPNYPNLQNPVRKDMLPSAPPPLELTTCLPSDEIAPMFHGTQW
jgi:hypothetical protein